MSKLTTDNFSLSASLNLSRSSTGNAAARLNSDYSQIQTDNSNSPVNRLRLGGSSQTYSNVSNSKKMIEVQGDDTKGKRSWDSGNGKKKYDRN